MLFLCSVVAVAFARALQKKKYLRFSGGIGKIDIGIYLLQGRALPQSLATHQPVGPCAVRFWPRGCRPL